MRKVPGRLIGRPFAVVAFLFLSCISAADAVQPIVMPLRRYAAVMDRSTDKDYGNGNVNGYGSGSGNGYCNRSDDGVQLKKRAFHSPMPIHYENNEFYDANIKGVSYMVGFFISHFIGTPPQQINTLIDTGSSNLAISCAPSPKVNNYFDPLLSSTYVRYHGFYASAELRYADGQMGGDLAGDVEWISTANSSELMPYMEQNLTVYDLPASWVQKVSVKFACIMYSSKGIFISSSWQGVMGMAYGTIVRPSNRYETFFDSLVQQTGLPNVFTLQLCGIPFADQDNSGALRGNIIFGGTDSQLQSTAILYTQLVTESFYGILIVDMLVNNQSLGLPCTEYNDPVSIIDSGTSNWIMPAAAYDALVAAIKPEVNTTLLQSGVPDSFWDSSLQLCLTDDEGVPWAAFPTITLHIALGNGSTNEAIAVLVPPSSYIRIVGAMNGEFCYAFSIHSSNSTMVNSIIGLVVLEGLYLEFDRANSQVGIAQSANCTNDNQLALVHPRVFGPVETNCSSASLCLPAISPRGYFGSPALAIVGAVAAGLIVLALILFVLLFHGDSQYSSAYSPIGNEDFPESFAE